MSDGLGLCTHICMHACTHTHTHAHTCMPLLPASPQPPASCIHPVNPQLSTLAAGGPPPSLYPLWSCGVWVIGTRLPGCPGHSAHSPGEQCELTAGPLQPASGRLPVKAVCLITEGPGVRVSGQNLLPLRPFCCFADIMPKGQTDTGCGQRLGDGDLFASVL